MRGLVFTIAYMKDNFNRLMALDKITRFGTKISQITQEEDKIVLQLVCKRTF